MIWGEFNYVIFLLNQVLKSNTIFLKSHYKRLKQFDVSRNFDTFIKKNEINVVYRKKLVSFVVTYLKKYKVSFINLNVGHIL